MLLTEKSSSHNWSLNLDAAFSEMVVTAGCFKNNCLIARCTHENSYSLVCLVRVLEKIACGRIGGPRIVLKSLHADKTCPPGRVKSTSFVTKQFAELSKAEKKLIAGIQKWLIRIVQSPVVQLIVVVIVFHVEMYSKSSHLFTRHEGETS